MVDIVRPVFGEVWASSGEKLAPESTKIQSGWVQEMMPYQYENFLVNRQDVVITYLLQKGVAEWDAGQEYIGNKSTVMYMGALYVAAATSTGILPTNTTAWRRISTISSADGVISIMGGGTGASTAANARTNLGLGTMATQNANLVAITGGSINATPIGDATRSTGAFTSVNATGNITATSFTGPSTGDVTGNATSASILQTARTIGLSGGVTGTPTSFNGSSNIVIPVTAVNAASLTGAASISTTGNAATATALQTPRTITLSGGATATPTTFNGGSNITIPVTALNATNLTAGDVPEARMSLNAVTKTSATGSAKIPAGTTAQRDVSPTLGAQRFNTTTGLQEYWNGSAWVSFTGVALDSLVENYPSIRPTLNLDFVNSNMVDPRVTFTRASTATYYDAKGVLQTAPANVPRIDYDPMTGECKGLLIEESRTNLFTQSEFATGLAGNVTGGSVSATTFAGFSAGMSVQSSTAGNSYLYKELPLSDGVEYTFSLFIKMDDGGAPIISSSNTVGDMTLILEGNIHSASTLVHLGGGLYRASGTRVSTGVVVGPNWGVIKYATQSSRGFKVTGYQIEAEAFPTSYIPTTTSQVKRAADVASMTGENFSSWYKSDEGTIIWEGSRYVGYTTALLSMTDGTAGNATAYMYNNTTAASTTFQANAAGVTQATITTGALTSHKNYKVAGVYKVDDFASVTDGGAVGVDTSGVVAGGINILRIGCGTSAGAVYGAQRIKRITYWPKRLPDATLQALTAS